MYNYAYKADKLVRSGYYNDVIHDRLYFGDNDGGTSTIQSKEYQLFVNAVGQQTKNISSGAIVTQSKAETSLEGIGGTMPHGDWFVITQIGIHLEISNVQATEPFTNDAVTSINVTPLYRVSPIPLHQAIMSQCTFELYRNANELIEQGGLPEYPSGFTTQGFAGGGGASVPALAGGAQNAYTVNPTVFIDGGGVQFRNLTVYQELEEFDQFRGVLRVNREIALSSTLLCGQIDFYLVGRLMTEQAHQQFRAEFGSQGKVGA